VLSKMRQNTPDHGTTADHGTAPAHGTTLVPTRLVRRASTGAPPPRR
ncbi:LacI family transcriptional regulator, partial [Streptomyces ipomoeae]